MATTELSTPTTTSLADAGLLVLRIGVGATMIQAGLRKAFDFNTTVAFMEAGGWRLPNFAAFMVTAAMIDAWAVNVSAATFWSEPFNVPFLVAVGAAALLFTGAGSYSVDARIFGRWRFSPRVAMGLLILAVAAALLTWILLNGTNPIHFTAPEG
jgi:putative oxidoreductase